MTILKTTTNNELSRRGQKLYSSIKSYDDLKLGILRKFEFFKIQERKKLPSYMQSLQEYYFRTPPKKPISLCFNFRIQLSRCFSLGSFY